MYAVIDKDVTKNSISFIKLVYFVYAMVPKYYRVVQKRHKVYGTIILQPYITESCGIQ